VSTNRTRLAFSIGFAFGMIVVGTVNYLTFLNPSFSRNSVGALVAHNPSYSGFPFSMYEHAYISSTLVWSGIVGNLICGLVLCLVLGWVATKIPGRNARLE
jgi:hypothetical protein